jgi:hypothetical protein
MNEKKQQTKASKNKPWNRRVHGYPGGIRALLTDSNRAKAPNPYDPDNRRGGRH